MMTVFTCCNGLYKSFIPLFISSLLHNEESDVVCEVGVDEVTEEIRELVEVLGGLYGGRFLVRRVDFSSGVAAGSVRYLNEPRMKSEWVYVTDVDMIFLEGGKWAGTPAA